jgi:hypothetical protein
MARGEIAFIVLDGFWNANLVTQIKFVQGHTKSKVKKSYVLKACKLAGGGV